MKDYKEYLERLNGEFLSEHYEITENDVIMCQKYVAFKIVNLEIIQQKIMKNNI